MLFKVIAEDLRDYYEIEEEESYYSILPTTTAYSRNAIFSGLLPGDMERYHPDLWLGEDSEGGKNNQEHVFLERHLKKSKVNAKFSYHKIKSVTVQWPGGALEEFGEVPSFGHFLLTQGGGVSELRSPLKLNERK